MSTVQWDPSGFTVPELSSDKIGNWFSQCEMSEREASLSVDTF